MIDGPAIAIAEDDDDIRTQLAEYLEGEGFRVARCRRRASPRRFERRGP
ncbi:hypothetical protein [Methylobacterium indicum]|nr:hypothetical protein [Methylobacterium indicum]